MFSFFEDYAMPQFSCALLEYIFSFVFYPIALLVRILQASVDLGWLLIHLILNFFLIGS